MSQTPDTDRSGPAGEPPVDTDGFLDWFDRQFSDADADAVAARPRASIDTPASGPAAPMATRVVRRVFRRPIEWWQRPWPSERIGRVVITALSLFATTAVMASVLHFNPLNSEQDLIFDRTTPTGGDMGAHVWGPAFLRDTLLPNWQLSGWSMDWYGGMPVYRFYMVIPALMIVALDVVFPYGVAMKLVVISGLLLFPLSCWAFGRLASFRYPLPELFAFGGLCFVLDESFSIYGGNLKSTMAGEFSFSIALTLAMFGFGLFANGLRTGKYRVWSAVVLALACCSHGIVLLFVVGMVVVLWAVWMDRTRFIYGITTGITTFLLAAFWVVPFVFNHEYMTDMKYGFRPEGATDSFWDMFFPLTAPLDFFITTLAVIGFVASIRRRNLTGAAMGLGTLGLVAAVYLTRDSLPVIGLLWNPRLLPFVYLLRYLLMMIGIVELGGLFVQYFRDGRAADRPGFVADTMTAVATGLAVLLVVGFMFEALPGGGYRDNHGSRVYAWGPFYKTPPPPDKGTDALGDGWSRYNFLGYENRGPSQEVPEYYSEYHAIVSTMAGIGAERGCGRALWENNEANGPYGTTMALMLLPFWTDGCIGSSEGLFFEASGTTPYHFLATAAMSENSSNPVRELRYVDTDAAVGVRHLQSLGIRYVMLRTEAAKRQAAVQPELTLLASSGPWEVYLVDGSDVVVPLTTQPVVVRERGGDQRERHLEVGTSYLQHPEEWGALPADDGPDTWQRVSVDIDLNRREGQPGERPRKVDIVRPVEQIEPVALPEVDVSNVRIGQQSLTFDVDQIGVPVLVKVSYFPNWEASGADGPYRVAPNQMVVIPTSTTVKLSYGRSGLDVFAYLLTLVGIALCVLWRRLGDVRHAGPVPSFARPEAEVGAGAELLLVPLDVDATGEVDRPSAALPPPGSVVADEDVIANGDVVVDGDAEALPDVGGVAADPAPDADRESGPGGDWRPIA
jgi:hypothetical protein